MWRNLFRGAEDVDWEKVAMVVAYMRGAVTNSKEYVEVREMVKHVDQLWMSSSTHVQGLVNRESRGLKEPLDV